MDKDTKGNFIASIVLAGFVISVFYHYIQGVYLGHGYPHNTFLFLPIDRFRDFFVLLEVNQHLNPYLGGAASAQYPFLNAVSYAFTFFPNDVSFILYNLLIITAFVFLNAVSIRADDRYASFIKVFIFSFLTYPFLFTIDRGNLEGLLSIVLLFCIYLYQKKNYVVSAIFLGLAIAMKVFPVVLLILFIADRRYKESIYAVAVASGATLVSLILFRGGLVANLTFLFHGSNIGGNSTLALFLGNNAFVQRGVSLFTFSKIMHNMLHLSQYIDMTLFLKLYSAVMVAVFMALALFVLLVETEFWEKAALLVFSMLLFPHISADYKLMHVFVPLLLFVNSGKKSRLDFFYALMFAFLLIPKDYYLLKSVISDSGTYDISIAVILNPIIMLVMMVVILVSGMKNWSTESSFRVIRMHRDELKRLCGLKAGDVA